MNAVEVFQDWLDQYLNFEHNPKKGVFWLDTIKYLCDRFQNPETAFNSFHIAGSKGKGSVSKMISCILDKSGYKTGVYSSPHIIDFRERIETPEGFFPEGIYEAAIKEMVPRIESILPEQLPGGRSLTWFELVTLFGFLCFRQAKIDWGVFEVGMGGRLDSTNIITPKISCINVIELEHTEYLGDTIEKIAYEKAGIIKEGVPVLVGHQVYPEASEVFKKVAAEKHAPIYFVDDLISEMDYSYTDMGLMEVNIKSSLFARPLHTFMPMLGSMQLRNACMAALAVKMVLPETDEKVIERGLSNAMLPGRFEILHSVRNYPEVQSLILDGAHTVNSINLTIQTLKEVFPEARVNLLFACAADKDVKDIAPLFKGKFNHIFLTKPGNVKQSDIESAKKAFDETGLDYIYEEDFGVFIPRVLKQTARDQSILLVTGSFYLVAEVKKALGLWN